MLVAKEPMPKAKKKEKPKKRVFRGFKGILRAKAEGLAIETEVRYAKIDSRDVDLAIKIKSRQRSTEEEVRYTYIGDYHKGYVRLSDGVEVPKDDVEFLQELPDGELVEVEKFIRTKIFEVTDYIPSRDLDNFFICIGALIIIFIFITHLLNHLFFIDFIFMFNFIFL